MLFVKIAVWAIIRVEGAEDFYDPGRKLLPG